MPSESELQPQPSKCPVDSVEDWLVVNEGQARLEGDGLAVYSNRNHSEVIVFPDTIEM